MDSLNSRKNNFIIILLILAGALSAQSLTPVFPRENRDLIHIEGEGAVATNFASTPTLNYSTSGQRTLQLNRYTSLYENRPFFVEFSLYAEESGNYTLWYGGTPPGPKEELYPSYSSPFELIVDGESAGEVYREDVIVNEAYAPGFYWISVKEIPLEKGIHTIRLEIKEKRRYDGKFYFFLDSLFLFKGDPENPGEVPPVFPSNMNETRINNPFRSISYYENRIRENPDALSPYLSLASIYTLIGEYLNAINMLNKALQIDPSHEQALLLRAKNRIWKGDISDGLRAYRNYLNIYPQRDNIWNEAGKIAAWTAKYPEAKSLYSDGLNLFPENLSLNVNLGLTLLWSSEINPGLEKLTFSEELSEGDFEKIESLGEIYIVNGYEDRAETLYLNSIEKYPKELRFYMKLSDLYSETGRQEEADALRETILSLFIPSERLNTLLETSAEKQKLRGEYIKSFEDQLKEDPQNLFLREMLVQTYFWNGMTMRAVEEYLNILTAKNYTRFIQMEKDNSDIYLLTDSLHLAHASWVKEEKELEEVQKLLRERGKSYFQAMKNHERFLLRVEKARKNNKPDPIPLTPPTDEILEKAGDKLAEAIYRTDLMLARGILSEDVISSIPPEILQKEKEDQEKFSLLTAGKEWEWDREGYKNELKEVSSRGLELADYILARISLFTGEYPEAEEALLNLRETHETSFILAQSEIWKEGEKAFIPPGEEELIYAPYREKLLPLIEKATKATTSQIFYIPELYDMLPGYFNRLEERKKAILSYKETAEENLSVLKDILINRMERTLYNYEEETYLIRFELADYYLALNQYDSSIHQLYRVLNMDPWNTAAKYKLGSVMQISGNWSGAMKSYRDVFISNPQYEQTITRHNQIARTYPNTLSGKVSFFTDTGRIVHEEGIEYISRINTLFSISPRWFSESYRTYTYSGSLPPRNFRLDSLEFSIPLTFGSFSLTPSAGGSAATDLWDDIHPNDNSDFNALVNSFNTFIRLGLNSTLSAAPYTLNINLLYKPLTETIHRNITPVNSLGGDLTLSGYFPVNNDTPLSSLSFRSFFKLDRRDTLNHENYIFTTVQEGVAGLIVNRAPWTILNGYLTLSLENGSIKGTEIYYTPHEVISVKAGITAATWLSPVTGRVLGLSGRLAGGTYINRAFSNKDISGIVEGEIGVEYTLADTTLRWTISGSASMHSPDKADYWSLMSTLTVNVKIPELLTP